MTLVCFFQILFTKQCQANIICIVYKNTGVTKYLNVDSDNQIIQNFTKFHTRAGPFIIHFLMWIESRQLKCNLQKSVHTYGFVRGTFYQSQAGLCVSSVWATTYHSLLVPLFYAASLLLQQSSCLSGNKHAVNSYPFGTQEFVGVSRWACRRSLPALPRAWPSSVCSVAPVDSPALCNSCCRSQVFPPLVPARKVRLYFNVVHFIMSVSLYTS